MSPSTSAALPPAKYARPSLVDGAVRQVNFVDPDGRSKVFDFTDIPAAPTLLDDLVRAFVSGVAPGGRWQSVATAEAVAGTVKHLARYLTEFHPNVVSLVDLNSEVWWAWRSEKEQNTRWPGQVTMMRALLSEATALPQSTRRAMRAKAVKNSSEVEQARQNPEAVAPALNVPVHTLKLLLAGHLDTPTAACTDFFGSPFADEAGQSCPASFFACFPCGNAVVTPRHLPRLVVLLDALDDIATVVTPPQWDRDLAEHYARLRTVLTTNATTAEIIQARGVARDEDREMVCQLLNRRLDG